MNRPITSPANPRVKALARLRVRRERDRTGTFPVEGEREVRRALQAGLAITELYVCPDLAAIGLPSLLAEAGDIPVVELASGPFHKVSNRQKPDGIMAVARQFDTSLERLSLASTALVLAIEAIEKPGNLGTMLRTAAAAGVAAVVVCDPATDPFNPNVVRASMGALFEVPLAVAPSAAAIARFHERRLPIFAASPAGDRDYWEVDLSAGAVVAIGAEAEGLSPPWMEAAHARVRIPMEGALDSLNAATSAGLLLFEAVRQRRGRD